MDADEERRFNRDQAEDDELGLLEPPDDVDPFDHIVESPESVFGVDEDGDDV